MLPSDPGNVAMAAGTLATSITDAVAMICASNRFIGPLSHRQSCLLTTAATRPIRPNVDEHPDSDPRSWQPIVLALIAFIALLSSAGDTEPRRAFLDEAGAFA